MTYRELLSKLQAMTQDKLDDDVTVYFESHDEYFAVNSLNVQDGDDVLHDGHRYLSAG